MKESCDDVYRECSEEAGRAVLGNIIISSESNAVIEMVIIKLCMHVIDCKNGTTYKAL